ncbi:hypothetical protein [Cellulomonas sp. P5_E12]
MADHRPDRRWLILHLALLAVAGVVLVWVNRDQWFVGDEWEFLINRGFSGAALNIWVPHNEHWSTIPILVWVALRDTVGLASYWPYILVLIGTHLALAHFVWRAALASGAAPVLATAGAAVFSLLGSGSENLLWAFQIGFVGSVAFGWLAMLVGDREGRLGRRDVATVGLLVCALMCSGIGVPAVAAAAVATLVRSRDIWRTVVVGGVPTVVYLVWYLLVGSVNSGAPAVSGDGPVTVVVELWDGVLTILHGATGAPTLVAASVALFALVTFVWAIVHAVRRDEGSRDRAVAVGGFAGLMLFLSMVVAARGGLEAPRYAYVATAFGLPLLVVGLSAVTARVWFRALVVAAFGVVLVYNTRLLVDNSVKEAAAESITRQKVTAAAHLAVTQDEQFLGSQIDPRINPDVTVEGLGPLARDNGLPTSPITPFGLSSALVMLDVGVGDGPLEPLVGTPVVTQTFEAEAVDGQKCWQVGEAPVYARVLLESDEAPFGVEVRGEQGRTFQLRVGVEEAEGDVRTVAIPEDGSLVLTTQLASGVPLNVGFLPAETLVCAVAP